MNRNLTLIVLSFALGTLTAPVHSEPLPRLEEGFAASEMTSQEQKKLSYLEKAYLSTSPEDLGDGLEVGVLDRVGAKDAVAAIAKADQEGDYANLDSLLLWRDGKLLFEYYNRRGRVDGPHYMMSVTKTMTSVVLARALATGLLETEDLDKPVIDFLTEIDRSRIQKGVETITIRDALMMKSGLRFPDKGELAALGRRHQKQAYIQRLFELTAPVTPESKEFKYTGTDPSLVMMVIDAQCPGTVQDFIAGEVVAKFQGVACWGDQDWGIPKCGAGSSFSSRSVMKFAIAMMQEGKWRGEQLLSAEYAKQVMAPKDDTGYYFYFHNRTKTAAGQQVRFISGIGAGGQYMSTFPDLNIVITATSHNKGDIGKPLDAMMDHLLPLFLN